MKKKFLLSLSVGLIVSIFLSSMSAFSKECELIRENTLRLHIIAASDSDADQALKLMVRDRILEESGGVFTALGNAEECKRVAEENLDRFISTANAVVKDAGSDYEVRGEVVEMFFENKKYGDVTLPAGRYKAVRLIIGEGAGQNWWCVLFPPLCIPGCSIDKESEELLSPTTGDAPELEVKLWIVELYEKLKEKFLG